MAESDVVAFAPGRANLIGEHTDFNDGLALPFAVAQGVRVRARETGPGDDEMIVVHSSARASPLRLDARSPEAARFGDWRDFPRGAVGELLRAEIPLRPCRLEVTSTLPEGAGLSSSAALSVSLCMALLELNGERADDAVWLARLCSRIENEWVGANTGLLDQLAVLLGRERHALRIDFRALTVDPIPLSLGDWRIVLLDSGERHELSASGYGERRRECERAREELGLASLRDATLEQAARLPEPLNRRARHVIEENSRVEASIGALARGDLETLGRLLDESHRSLRDDYECSTDAVERTVTRLKSAGACGARIMGGGFGGSVIALMPPDAQPPDQAVAVEPAAGAHTQGRSEHAGY